MLTLTRPPPPTPTLTLSPSPPPSPSPSPSPFKAITQAMAVRASRLRNSTPYARYLFLRMLMMLTPSRKRTTLHVPKTSTELASKANAKTTLQSPAATPRTSLSRRSSISDYAESPCYNIFACVTPFSAHRRSLLRPKSYRCTDAHIVYGTHMQVPQASRQVYSGLAAAALPLGQTTVSSAACASSRFHIKHATRPTCKAVARSMYTGPIPHHEAWHSSVDSLTPHTVQVTSHLES